MTFQRLFGGLGRRIALVALVAGVLAISILAGGVLLVGHAAFNRLMVAGGSSAATADAMFQHSVASVFGLAAVAAVVASGLLAAFLAGRLARPLDEMARAARRIAGGDYEARVPRSGPEELASLADSFNQMAAGLAEQERLRREFIINAAHEIRTPLTNLQGYLEALRDGVIEPSPEQFSSLHEETERLLRLSRSLDMLADPGWQRSSLELQEVDLSQAVGTAYELARATFEAKEIKVDLKLPERLPARAQGDLLAQVLANLLQNASRYTPAGGHVVVGSEARSADVLVWVSNSGDGIPARDLPRVFERFYRVEKSRDRARGGAGIGLAIVKQLVESAGGQVGADSNRDGTRIWFSLPA